LALVLPVVFAAEVFLAVAVAAAAEGGHAHDAGLFLIVLGVIFVVVVFMVVGVIIIV
jgi:hypothetical protein